MASDETGYALPVGRAEVQRHFAHVFFSHLWERPARRKQWALRHRTEAAVGQVADDLGWTVAAGLHNIIPTEALTITIKHAIGDELAYGQHLDRSTGETNPVFYGITPRVSKMLDWLVRHYPDRAQHMIGELVGDAERRFGIPREVTGRSLRKALALDGKLEKEARGEFLDRVLPPTPTAQ